MDTHHYRAEMDEGCTAIRETFATRDRVASAADRLADADRIYAVGCGSSYWTATVAAAWFRERGRDAISVPASEFALSPYPVDAGTAVLAYSQPGETTETVGAVEGIDADVVAVTNTAGSTLDGLADRSVVTPAGEEHAVLASESVDTALAVSWLLAAGREGPRRRASRAPASAPSGPTSTACVRCSRTPTAPTCSAPVPRTVSPARPRRNSARGR